MTFINIQTGYSFLSSTLLSEHLKQYQNTHPTIALGIANVNAFFDLRELHHQLSNTSTKIVTGMTLRTKDNDVISDWVIYPKNEQGMTILKELTAEVSHNRHKDYPSGTVLPSSQHLLYIMPSLHGYIGTQIGLDNQERIREELLRIKQRYTSFYIGINLPSTQQDEEWNRCLRSLAQQYGIPCIAFPRIRTLTRDENRILDVLAAIREGTTIDNLKIHQQSNESLVDMDVSYFSPTEWHEASALTERVEWKPSKHKKLPMPFQVPQADVDINTYLKALAQRGLQRRFPTQSIPTLYRERLQHELDVIISLGYADYFLVVYDYVKYAKTHGILVGPGRGSGAASLVCYTLGITDVDPLKYGLLFERFLNPERVSMPDIDVDFQDDRRQDVITYLREKYTNEHFAHVIAFTRFQAKSALRDVAKAIGLSLLDADRLAKAVPATSTLKETYQSNVGFRALIDSHPLFSDVYNVASRIEELPRQTTLHAAGVVISKDRLASLTPVYEQEPRVWTTQYDMTYIEDEGLLKMDVLGLKNLTIIQNTLASINAVRTSPITLSDISFDDPQVYELIRSGRTSGIFQLESGGIINEAIKVVLPENFEDIVSILALFRPGPKEYIPTYAARKHGQEAYRIEPAVLEPILKPTYGIIVYQEQIMQIVQIMAGFSIGKADIIRRAISKKKESEMLKIREEFLAGSQAKGHQRAEAEQVFELILKFADYGFARAHAVAYAVVSVQMAYLKVHYPSHFYAAVLNSFALGSNDTKLQDYLNEIRRLGLRVARPSIRLSGKEFVAQADGVIQYALGAINGIGAVLVDAILSERQVRPFKDFLDIVVRLPQKLRQEKALHALIDAGAFDDFEMNRASLRVNVPTALNFASIYHQSGQLTPLDPPRLQLVKSDKMEDLEREYRVLGTFLSGFPLQERRSELNQMGYITIHQMDHYINRSVRIMAYINEVRTIKTKKGEAMALVTVYDETDTWTIPVFPKLFQSLHTVLTKGEFATFEGRVEMNEQRLGLMLFNVKIESRERYV